MDKCTVVAKRELFYAWPFGLAAWLAGLIFIDRVRGEKARDTLNQVNSKIKKQKIKLWVFPEGTRRNTGDIHPFKKGAFHMAIDEQIPILPVVFSSYCSFLNDKKKILNAGNIIVTTLPAIPTKGLRKEDLPELMEKVHKLMQETFKQTSNEILQRYASTSSGITRTKHATTLETNTLTTTSTSAQQSLTAAATTTLGPTTTTPLTSTNSLCCDYSLKCSDCSPTTTTTTSTSSNITNANLLTATSQAENIVNTTRNTTAAAPEAVTATTTTTTTTLETTSPTTDFKKPVTTKTQALVH